MMLISIVVVGVALLAASVVGGLVVVGRRVPAVVGLLPAALPLIGAMVTCGLGVQRTLTTADTGPVEVWVRVVCAGLSSTAGETLWLAQFTVAPALVLLCACAFAGARQGPRQLGAAISVGVLSLLLGLVPLLTVDADALRIWDGRGLLYVLCGLFAATAALSGDPERAGPEGGAIATGAFALLAIGVESAALLHGHALLYSALEMASPDRWQDLFASGSALMPFHLFSLVIVTAMSILIALIGIGTVPPGQRRLLAGAGLVVLLPLGIGMSSWVDMRPTLVVAWKSKMDAAVARGDDAPTLPNSSSSVALHLRSWMHIHSDAVVVHDGTRIPLPEPSDDVPAVSQVDALAELLPSPPDLLVTLGEPLQPLLVADGSTPAQRILTVAYAAEQQGWDTSLLAVRNEETGRLAQVPFGLYRAQPTLPTDGPHFDLLVEANETQMHVSAPGQSWRIDCEDDGCGTGLARLRSVLGNVKSQHPDEDAFTLLLSPTLPLQRVVHILDMAREEPITSTGEPDVLFPHARIGLNTAAEIGARDLRGGSGEDALDPESGDGDPAGEGDLVQVGEDATIIGGLDMSVIDTVIARHLNQIRYCYQRELVHDPGLGGTIVVKFVIARDGSVSRAQTDSSTMGSPDVEDCINQRFMHFQFPEPDGGGIAIVKYPFLFTPD